MASWLQTKLHLTPGTRSYGKGCALIVGVSAIVTVLVKIGLDAPYARHISADTNLYWVIFAGAVGGSVALFLARGWLGAPGAFGFARAMIGSIAIALMTAIIAGTLIVPAGGTIYAPLMMVSAFIAKPWIAALWFVVTLAAHTLMTALRIERDKSFELVGLSAWSRTNIFNRN